MAFVLLASCGQTTGVCEAVPPASKPEAAVAEADCSSTFLEDSSARLTNGTNKAKETHLRYCVFKAKGAELRARSSSSNCQLEHALRSAADPTAVSVEVGQYSMIASQESMMVFAALYLP